MGTVEYMNTVLFVVVTITYPTSVLMFEGDKHKDRQQIQLTAQVSTNLAEKNILPCSGSSDCSTENG